MIGGLITVLNTKLVHYKELVILYVEGVDYTTFVDFKTPNGYDIECGCDWQITSDTLYLNGYGSRRPNMYFVATKYAVDDSLCTIDNYENGTGGSFDYISDFDLIGLLEAIQDYNLLNGGC